MSTHEHLTRQLDIIPLEVLGEPITIIGAGAVGSWTTLALAKMGFCNLAVYDFDHVSTENMNSQMYRLEDVSTPKVGALGALVTSFTGVTITTRFEAYERGVFPGIVISAVDSMAVRRRIWENHAMKSPGTRAVIDPRMGAESALLYVRKPMNERDCYEYPKTLYSDDSAVQERCTAKATIYTANLLSGLVCKAVKDLLTRPDYLRTCQWDIAENDMLCFKASDQKGTNHATLS